MQSEAKQYLNYARWSVILLFAFILAVPGGCKKKDAPIEAPSIKLDRTSAELSKDGGGISLTVTANTRWTISCDASWLTYSPASGASGTVSASITASANSGEARTAAVTFTSLQKTASATLTISQDGTAPGKTVVVPDKEGFDIKGWVHCGDDALSGVEVSDGYEVTTTDKDGFYWLNSAKKAGYVFISIPRGYFPDCDGSLPKFWQALSGGEKVIEEHSFALGKAENTDYVLIVGTDPHLAARNNDLTYYNDWYLNDVRKTAESYPGKPAYGLMLGDLTWDIYWSRFTLNQFHEKAKDYPVPLFTVMGNHDYDMSVIGDDFKASAAYRSVMGPIWYSFNLGTSHYVVLDDIYYTNPGGERSHDTYVDDYQLAWLKKDLANVSDKSAPLYICMHCRGFYASGVTTSGNLSIAAGFSSSAKSQALANALTDFSRVYYLTGDTHCNTHLTGPAMPSYASNITEHNIAAVCASWWWTNELSDNSICRDGSEGGYMVFLNGSLAVNAKSSSTQASPAWYYKGMLTSREKQFRCYDMNSVKEYFATNSNAKTFLAKYPSRETYSSYPANSVLINVWAWQPDWTVKVEELASSSSASAAGRAASTSGSVAGRVTSTSGSVAGRVASTSGSVAGRVASTSSSVAGTSLAVSQKFVEDPLHTLSYDIPRTVTNGETTSSFTTIRTHHIFCVTASSATTTLRITVTDSFGNVFTEDMTRPRTFQLER
jgi:hypothetical protein